MRFLADENIPASAVAAIRRAGHDVLWLREAAPAASDHDAIAMAIREARIILTFDKDFGELAVQSRMPDMTGVILLRLPMSPGSSTGEKIAARLNERTDWAGHFSVIEPARIRMRQLNLGMR